MKDLVPPLLWRALQALKRRWSRPDWRLAPEGFAHRDAAAKAWDEPALAQAAAERVGAYAASLRGAGAFNLNPEAPEKGPETLAQSIALTYAYALALAAAGRPRLKLLDWGGGAGMGLALARASLPGVEIDYSCQDLPALCAEGKKRFPEARFLSEPDACFAEAYDLVIAGSSLWYVEAWQAKAAQLARSAKPWLLVAKTGFDQAAPSYVAVQTPALPG
jgi:putative methyltransferase (TIGR04325 family)